MSTRSLHSRVERLEAALLSDEQFGPSTDVPFGALVYDPTDELVMRKEIDLLTTRLRSAGREVLSVDLGAEMWECLRAHPDGPDGLPNVERSARLDHVLSEARTLLTGPRQNQAGPLEQRVTRKVSALDPSTGVALLYRAGELFPIYRTSALLERMISSVRARTVLFYPGELRGATELSFMGVMEPSPNYRPRVFA